MLFFDDLEGEEELFLDERNIDASSTMKEATEKKKKQEKPSCSHGRAVCCGKHKGCCRQEVKIHFISRGKRR